MNETITDPRAELPAGEHRLNLAEQEVFNTITAGLDALSEIDPAGMERLEGERAEKWNQPGDPQGGLGNPPRVGLSE